MFKKMVWSKFAALTISACCANAYASVELGNYTSIPTGSWSEALAVGDLNNDGLDDVALITSTYFDPDNDYKLKIYLQNESGNLDSPVNYPLIEDYTRQPGSIALGDLNNDGLLDVVVGLDRGYIQVFVQNQAGGLQLQDTIQTSHSTRISVGDLNGDGLADISGISWSGNDIGVFYQTLAGLDHQAETFHAPHGGYNDMVLGDINNDGKNDIVVMSGQGYNYDNLAVVESDRFGNLGTTRLYDLGGDQLSNGVAITDTNNDGKNDVVVTYGGNQPTSMIAVFLQDDAGYLAQPVSYQSYDIPEAIIAADLNNDQQDELLVLHGGWYALGVYEQFDNTILPEQLFSIGSASNYNPQGISVGDINNDGANDVVIADYNNGMVILHGLVPTNGIAPVSIAGNDQSVEQNSSVQLDGTGSYDDDGAIVNYTWSQVSGTSVQLNNVSDGVVALTSPVLPPSFSEDLVFELTVTDNDGLSTADTVVITIQANQAPVADAGSDYSVKQRRAGVLDASLSNDDGEIVSYSWTQLTGSPVAIENASETVAAFTAPALKKLKSEVLVFRVMVTDNLGQTSTDTVSVLVTK